EPGLFDLAKSLLAPTQNVLDPESGVENSFVVNPGVLQQFKEQLTVYSSKGSRVVVVEFWSKDRTLAKLVPNTLAEEYLEFTRSATLESDRSATGFLEPEIEELRNQVRTAEEKVAEFRSNSDILLGNNNALLATQQLSEVSSELSRVRAEAGSAEAKVASIRAAINNGGSIDVIPEVISSPLIQRLRERQVTIQGDISQLSTTLLPNHPRIKALNSQLPEIERQIRIAANNILTSLENNVDLAKKQEQALLQDVNRLKAESSRVGEAEVQLRALEREANAQRERLESYLGRFNEAQSRQASGYVPSEARIIEHAVLPSESYFPKVIPFTIAGMLGVAILSILGVLVTELLSGRAFKTMRPIREEDIPEKVEAVVPPALAPNMNDLLRDPVPAFAPTPQIANDRDVFGISFAMQAIESLGKASVAVVSAGSSLSTPAAIELTRYLANKGHGAVIADFTSEANATTALLGNADVVGMFDVLSGANTLREVLYSDNASNAHVLAPGNTSNPATDVSRLPQLIDALRKNYAFTVFDCAATGVEGLMKIADQETVIIIPVSNQDLAQSKALEQALKQAGFSETLLVRESSRQNGNLFNAA
ncbi:MAG: exopolysaccharide transport family protein, partial [Salaquimonas sp.]